MIFTSLQTPVMFWWSQRCSRRTITIFLPLWITHEIKARRGGVKVCTFRWKYVHSCESMHIPVKVCTFRWKCAYPDEEAFQSHCPGAITKNFCVLHIQSNTTIFHLVVQWEYNYMFRPYMWTIFRLWFNLQNSYTRCVGCSFRVLGLGGRNEISLFR